MTTTDGEMYYGILGKEVYLERRKGVTPRMVAEHIVERPYFGRDRQLAEGWLVLIEAIESGEEDPMARLPEFVTLRFLHSDNNGVPLEKEGYKPKPKKAR